MAYSSLAQSRALVVGGSSGIGEATPSAFRPAAATLPARAVGQPEDIANAVLFLASTPYAAGSTVLVDGGGTIAPRRDSLIPCL